MRRVRSDRYLVLEKSIIAIVLSSTLQWRSCSEEVVLAVGDDDVHDDNYNNRGKLRELWYVRRCEYHYEEANSYGEEFDKGSSCSGRGENTRG